MDGRDDVCDCSFDVMQVKQMELKDQRTKMINEVLSGIKVIKLYAWERPFIDSISEIRRCELAVLRKALYINGVFSCSMICAPFMVQTTFYNGVYIICPFRSCCDQIAAVAFATYSLSGHNLTPSTAFVSLALLNLLRLPLGMVPWLLSSMTEAYVSLKRLSAFLLSEELDLNAVARVPKQVLDEDHEEDVVTVDDGAFCWKSNGSATLQR